MNKIYLEFLTEKGKETYKEIANKPQTFREKMIVNKIFQEKITSTNPLRIEINCRIPWLAVQQEIDKKIIEQMSFKGCDRDLDYVMEVV